MRNDTCESSRVAVFISLSLLAMLMLSACTRDEPERSQSSRAPLTVPKVTRCASGDHPETGLQGQVPAALRATGFKGFNCNLKLIGQYPGEGGGFSSATFNDRAGHSCAYYATGYIKDFMGQPVKRVNPGVAVVDITQPSHPTHTTSLTSTAMMDPWESLRVNPRRQVLAGNFGANSEQGGAEIDFYDLSGDCRYPQLLSSAAVGTGTDGGLKLPKSPLGHEGSFAPDGMTYYIGDLAHKTYNAVDVASMTHPKLISQFDMSTAPFAGPGYVGTAHGLGISDDGNRGYFTVVGFPRPADLSDPSYKYTNGFYIVDTSEVQSRKPDAQMRLISAVAVKDGSLAQAAIPATIHGKPYLVFVDEGGSVGGTDTFQTPADYASDVQAACGAGRMPFPAARIFDLTDERNPKLVSKLMLETHDPANCAKVAPDLAGLAVFTYGSHYCTVDNRQNATALACAYFNSGIRVFDIRDPSRPKEIAYYNPPGVQSKMSGSIHAMAAQWHAGGPDWCASRLDFDFARRTLTTMCMDNGLVVLEFEKGSWPLPESTAANEQTN